MGASRKAGGNVEKEAFRRASRRRRHIVPWREARILPRGAGEGLNKNES